MNYDLAIIGAGWAGFNAALRAKSFGLSVCLIEKGPIGGTCLNQGCIPAKALIQSAKIFSTVKKSSIFGVESRDAKPDLGKIQSRKENIINSLRAGMRSLLKGIDFINARAEFISADELKLDNGGSVKARNFLIATGSRPLELEKFRFDGKKILSSDHMLQAADIPPSLLVVGGGFIGCEFASLFGALGSSVTIVEKLPQLLPGIDSEAARSLQAAYKKKGIEVITGADAAALDLSRFDIVLVAVGRIANVDGLGLEKAGVKTGLGVIDVDDTLRTSEPNIYACGDCAARIMLAHYAAYQGRVAAENIAHPDQAKKINNSLVPSCVFSDPEIGAVGVSEEEARKAGRQVKVQKSYFMSNGMARVMGETDGFVKIISDGPSGEILGGVIVGPRATELIACVSLAATNRLKTADIRETIFAHPTLSEILAETA